MKITVIQMESTSDKASNVNKTFQFLEKAKDSDLVVFPEYQIYLPDFRLDEDMAKISEAIDGSFLTEISKIAARRRQRILVNIPEKNSFNLKPFNTAVFVDELGLFSKYRKLHLFDAFNFRESNSFQRGDTPPRVFNGSGFPVGVQICYDLRFPEPARILALSGAMIIVYQAGWFAGERKYDQWKTLLKSRAMENGVFVVGSAQTGSKFTGHSMVVSPYGDILMEMGMEEGYVTVDLDPKVISEYRETVPVLKHRRTDVYDVLDVEEFKMI